MESGMLGNLLVPFGWGPVCNKKETQNSSINASDLSISNDINSLIKTTSFDYHSFESNLFKLDLLGHEVPLKLKQLLELSNRLNLPIKQLSDIPIDDSKIYKLFNNQLKTAKGTLLTTIGIPEFGTEFVRQILKEIYESQNKLFNFTTLVKVSGLSHGTDVWLNNAQSLLKNKKLNINFEDIIANRDDIMNYLISKGIESIIAFEIMETVRKNLQNKNTQRWIQLMNIIKDVVPSWFIDSLNIIKYLFPKAHATAYVYSALQITYFKIYYPILFYSVYFSTKLDQFNYYLSLKSISEIEKEVIKLRKKVKKTVKENSLLTNLELILESKNQNIQFLPIDINESALSNFKIIDRQYLLLPFTSIDGLGIEKATEIINERSKKPFTNFEDFKLRTKLNSKIIKII